MARIQDRYWAAEGFAPALREEIHFGRKMCCLRDRPKNLATHFDDLVRRFAERPAVLDETSLSYRELSELAEAFAAGLAARGLSAGDRVALLLGNCWEFTVAALGCIRSGMIVVPIGVRQRRAELLFLLNDCGAAAIVFDAGLAESLPEPADVPALLHRFALRGEAEGAAGFAELLRTDGNRPPAPEIGEEDTAVILYTSGTTGRPKGARLTHLGIIHSACSFAGCVGLSEEDRAMAVVPLSHVTGLVGIWLSTLIVGGCLVPMHRPYTTPEFLELASRQRITYSILVPAIYTLCAMEPDLERYDLSAWRIGCFGGAPMPVATIERLAEKLPRLTLINAYGATETTSPTTIMPPRCWREHMDSVGQVVPCGDVRIVDQAGRPLPPGESGEVWIAGPMVVPGYWQRPDANESEFVQGFWRSGDIGAIDADGFLRVFDRLKDMINRGGYKVFSAEVENVLSHLPGLGECAVVGTPDPVLGERVHAFVVARPGASLTEEAVQRFAAEQLADYKVPESVTVLTEPLPRNANGKIQKTLLRQRLAELGSRGA